jgi:hypothetical protein
VKIQEPEAFPDVSENYAQVSTGIRGFYVWRRGIKIRAAMLLPYDGAVFYCWNEVSEQRLLSKRYYNSKNQN